MTEEPIIRVVGLERVAPLRSLQPLLPEAGALWLVAYIVDLVVTLVGTGL